jgi:hypothetical protein
MQAHVNATAFRGARFFDVFLLLVLLVGGHLESRHPLLLAAVPSPDDRVVANEVAEGFWYLSWYVKSWSEHANFPRPFPAEYYNAAYERPSDLAYWLFTGESISTDETALERALPGEPVSTS